MEIIKRAIAGTLESSDAYVEIEPGDSGIRCELESVVEQQFGDSIRRLAEEVLADCGVKNANIRITDRGALECVIRARIEAAVMRGKGE
ncbi:MAG: citrate lyase acyl carrier protein [Oscillospiraceae bacterium]|jgi:citrate lyase acyl carrier protein|nr:citrate lyase acyl carrier protein [Clostridia bacterium]MBQ2061140.1 citrate lyase acyl carrier protein [Oscillospiraceae bacterium]